MANSIVVIGVLQCGNSGGNRVSAVQKRGSLTVGIGNRVPFLNAFFDNVDLDEALGVIQQHIESGNTGFMMSINTAIMVTLEKDSDFRNVFKKASLVLMDSQPLIWVARNMGILVRQKLSGSDIIYPVCEFAAKHGYSCYFLGGALGVADAAADRLRAKYPGLQVAGTYSPDYGFEKDRTQVDQLRSDIRSAHPDIAFVCLGTPKSEKLICRELLDCGVPFYLSIGAAIDFAAGNMKRAPIWVSEHGLEWFYRFLHEPKRLFKRYFIESWQLIGIYFRYRNNREKLWEDEPCA